MSLFQRAKFFKSAVQARDLPAHSRCEVAFAGRSNAGKSSALNVLAGRSGLAFVSKTPGRTRGTNYYSLGEDRFLVDLPGYGYAKLAKHERKPWGELLGEYLRSRSALAGLVLVLDCRRALTDLDRDLLEWFCPTGKPMHALLSKADKLSRAEALAVLRSVRRDLGLRSPLWSAQLFSSLKRTGIEEAKAVIGGWLATAQAAPAPAKKPVLEHGFRHKKAPGKRGE